MSEEEINIAIAEYRGWQILEPEVHRVITYHWVIEPDGSKSILPDCCNDLNEMREVEMTLSNEIYEEYWNQLIFVCMNEGEERMNSASAKLRAKAFVIIIGKWKE